MTQKRALILNGSPRQRGNCAWLISQVTDYFHRNSIAPTVVRAITLKSQNNGCIGCEGCQRSKEFECVFKDDVQPIVASMPTYDYVLFATPAYFFESTAQLKLVIDRMFSLIKTNSKGEYLHPFKSPTRFGLIVTAGGDEQYGIDLVASSFRRTADIFERTLETLLMPNAPLKPEEMDDPETYIKQVQDFCQRLTTDV